MYYHFLIKNKNCKNFSVAYNKDLDTFNKMIEIYKNGEDIIVEGITYNIECKPEILLKESHVILEDIISKNVNDAISADYIPVPQTFEYVLKTSSECVDITNRYFNVF